MRSLGFYICRCSVTKLCLTLWDPVDCGTRSFRVLHHLLEFAPVPVHWIGAAIQPSHPLLPPSPALNLSQHQSLSQRVSSACVCVCVCVCEILSSTSVTCYFFLSNLDSCHFFVFFLCLTAVTGTSGGLPWRLRWVGRVGILVSLPVLEGIFSAFHHWWCLPWVCLFIMLRYVPSLRSLLIIFVINRCWILSEAFPASVIWSYDFYSLIC